MRTGALTTQADQNQNRKHMEQRHDWESKHNQKAFVTKNKGRAD